MITDFDDFCTWMFVLIDDIRQVISPHYMRPRPRPDCNGGELITVAIVGEWNKETNLIAQQAST